MLADPYAVLPKRSVEVKTPLNQQFELGLALVTSKEISYRAVGTADQWG